jgi:hypothetical protein
MNHKYYVLQSSNGNISIVSEWNDLNKAIVAFHQLCATLWNAPDVIDGYAGIVYSAGFDVVGGYKEHIEHPEPEVAGE